MPTQPAQLWDNPLYAWQQQLTNGANLAKNLNPSTLLGLTLGTGLGRWLGYKFGNWQQARDEAAAAGNPNTADLKPFLQSVLVHQPDYDLGWKPQYQFPTAQKLFNERVTPNPSSWDWRQNLRQLPAPTQNLLSTTQSPTENPWGTIPLKFGNLTQIY